MRARQAVILVGGRGARLGALTDSTPKPLMPLGPDRVFLDEVLDAVARQGVDEVLLLAGYLGDQFTERYHGRTWRGARLKVLIEDAPAGTGGALLNARTALAETFFFLNGDTLFDVNLRSLEALLNSRKAVAGALALRWVDDAGRYGSVSVKGDLITDFAEKAPTEGRRAGLINGGVMALRRSILALIERLPCSLEVDLLPGLARAEALLGLPSEGYFIDIGLPQTLDQARRDLPLKRPALFLDRDGVINHDSGYTHRVDDLKLVEGARELIRKANDLGAFVFVVTNQAGVAHGLYDLSAVDRFNAALQDELASGGAHVDQFYICPFHPDAKVASFRHADHPDRKPNPGMILKALDDWPVIRERTVLIGDKQSDLDAASRAGVPAFRFEGGSLAALAGPVMRRLAPDTDA